LKRGTLLLPLALVVLLAAAVAVYDLTRRGTVAEGVEVGGVDVGGLNRDLARDKLARQLEPKLARRVEVRVGGRGFTLDAGRSKVRADAAGMADAALARSREGDPFSRTFRQLTGRPLGARLPARVSYDRSAVSRFASWVERRADRDARSARVRPRGEGIEVVSARRGVDVDARSVERSLARGLRGVRRRSVRAPAEFSRPKLSTAELRKRYPRYITVDRQNFRLRLYRGLKLKRTYTIAVGQVGFDTPAGVYRIQNKGVNPTWYVPEEEWAGDKAGKIIPPGPENPIKSRWMGIYDGAGIHGTDEVGSLGSRASHGCIRMAIPEVKQLYREIPVKTPVYIG